MFMQVNCTIITHLVAYIFEICDSFVSVPEWAMQLLEGLASVVLGNTLLLYVVKKVLKQMHLGEIPRIPLYVLLAV